MSFKKALLLLICCIFSSCSMSQPETSTVDAFRLTSNSFEEGSAIPARYTCDAENIAPHLRWSNAPVETKSFALSMTDPDAPNGEFTHWLVYNIPGDMVALVEGKVLNKVAPEIMNDFNQTNYGGPCPPAGKHRYIFTIYALDVESVHMTTKAQFADLVAEHTIAKAELMGTYQRP